MLFKRQRGGLQYSVAAQIHSVAARHAEKEASENTNIGFSDLFMNIPIQGLPKFLFSIFHARLITMTEKI